MTPETPEWPFITVVMPVRNEAGSIASSLAAVLTQDYPTSCVEVVVVDGASSDGTPDVVESMARRYDRVIAVVTNHDRIVPISLNLAMERARGEIIVRVDGHCVIAEDYLRRCVEVLRETGAACVGGAMETIGETPVARAIAAAQSSRFGVGGVAFRVGAHEPGPVDTVAFGAYRREVFERYGGFDPELERNQDDDFNYRLNRAGETVWLDPSIRSVYLSRASLGSLWSQYFGYGFYKVRVIQKNGLSSLRHLIPAALVSGLVAGVLTSALTRRLRWLAVIAVPYVVASFTSALVVARRRGVRMPLLLLAFATLHLAYGSGFLAGLSRWRSRPVRQARSEAS